MRVWSGPGGDGSAGHPTGRADAGHRKTRADATALRSPSLSVSGMIVGEPHYQTGTRRAQKWSVHRQRGRERLAERAGKATGQGNWWPWAHQLRRHPARSFPLVRRFGFAAFAADYPEVLECPPFAAPKAVTFWVFHRSPPKADQSLVLYSAGARSSPVACTGRRDRRSPVRRLPARRRIPDGASTEVDGRKRCFPGLAVLWSRTSCVTAGSILIRLDTECLCGLSTGYPRAIYR
jgi:hypothetical protein